MNDDRCLYRQVLGPKFDGLSPHVRSMHERDGFETAVGSCDVEWAQSVIAHILATLALMPPPDERMKLYIHFSTDFKGEVWARDFGECPFKTRLSSAFISKQRYLTEQLGPLRFIYSLEVDQGRLLQQTLFTSIFGIKLPKFLSPQIQAQEWEEEGWFCFAVDVNFPWVGKVIHYKGRLRPMKDHHILPSLASDSR